MLKYINKILANIAIFFIRIYQIILSPDKGIPSFWLKGKICLHTPHCSEYGISVLKRFGFIPGIFYSMERVASCNPWNDRHYDPPFFKVVFFSSAPIGQKFLENLNLDNRFDVVGVVTAPDKPFGRGMQVQENIIKSTAKKLGLNDIMTPEKISQKTQEGVDFSDWLKSKNPDFIVVIAYGKIIPKSILEIPNFGPINFHGSILPKYRGASPIQSCLLHGDHETGITIMKMSEKMDEGDMIKILKFGLPLSWTSLDIIKKMEEIGPKFLNDTLWDYGKGLVGSLEQDHKIATYCHKIEKEDGIVDINHNNLELIYNKYRAYYIWPKISFYIQINGEQKRFIIENIDVNSEIYNDFKHDLLFKENILNKSIKSIGIKPEGKKLITWDEFVRGYLK